MLALLVTLFLYSPRLVVKLGVVLVLLLVLLVLLVDFCLVVLSTGVICVVDSLFPLLGGGQPTGYMVRPCTAGLSTMLRIIHWGKPTGSY